MVTNIYNQSFRPDCNTEFLNLYLDGSHINTTIEIWSMEGAVESGKMISNSLTIVEEFTGKGVTIDPKAFPNFRIFIETNGRKILTPNKGFMYRVIANIKVTGYHVK